ncbi:bifunctional diguanylate cyclase/phosphodiesterase [Mesorhizobium loti]|nr:bifunctional diguanylate cyclase/phosphodiesterase [Mesorhizobium loti]PLP57348.1 bifunctional diguanylate cyclase/phosphodiesterase [Mesorhizobium loti]
MRVVSCLVTEHNPWLVLLAVFVCIAGSWVTFRLFRQAEARNGWQRAGWIFLAAQAAGSSIWCTHFIAVIAYEHDAPVTFDPTFTMVSLLIAVAGCAYGFWLSISFRFPLAAEVGGGVVGVAISAMHYSGMMAYRIDGLIDWNLDYVLASVALSVLFGGVSLRQAIKPLWGETRYLPVGFFVLAVASLHFTGMTAISVTPFSTAVDATASSTLAAFAVVGVGMLVLGAGVISYLIDEQSSQEAFDRLQKLALTDSLTGLPNRTSAIEHLDQEMERARYTIAKVAIIGIDLDRFKEINDLRGHQAGDATLATIGHRLGNLLQHDEFAARIGGDEFMCVKLFVERHQLDEFLKRLELVFSEPLRIGNTDLATGASLGVALYPDDGHDRQALISNADLAMYRAKADITRAVCFYEPQMDRAAREHHALASDLSHALELGQLELHYQVQKSVQSGDVLGYEALLRWNHPTRGPISPTSFIPIAEETGLILVIGEWVLRTACREAGKLDRPCKIAVNLSPVQFVHNDLAGLIRDILVETGLSPNRLELEITESTFIADKSRALHILRQIKGLGVKISIDDFGIGYSSFDTLRSFPFDKIKLDGSFTKEMERSAHAMAIVRSVLALGQSLGIPVLAEGVETAAQLQILRAEGCHEAQGYYLGRPGPRENILPASTGQRQAIPNRGDDFALSPA